MESLLDSLIYRNIFDVTELALDLTNINIENKDKRFRVKSSFLVISRRQKNRVVNGLSLVSKDKRLNFIIGCFMENCELIKKRIVIIDELSPDTKKNACEEIEKFNNEKITKLKEDWRMQSLDSLSEESLKEEIRKWKMWK